MQIRLFQFDSEKIEPLFTKAIKGGIEPPICFSNSVIIVNADCVVRKFNLNGDLLFEKSPSEITGACGWARRLGRQHIFMTETIASNQNEKFKYRLHIVDVSGSVPTVIKSFDIIQPYQVAYTWDEIVVSSVTDTVRVKIPEGL